MFSCCILTGVLVGDWGALVLTGGGGRENVESPVGAAVGGDTGGGVGSISLASTTTADGGNAIDSITIEVKTFWYFILLLLFSVFTHTKYLYRMIISGEMIRRRRWMQSKELEMQSKELEMYLALCRTMMWIKMAGLLSIGRFSLGCLVLRVVSV